MSKTIGIGVVGFGWMGQAHSRAYRNIPVYFAETGLGEQRVDEADHGLEVAPCIAGVGGGMPAIGDETVEAETQRWLRWRGGRHG